MLSIKFVGFLFHGVNNFFHNLQALLFISVGFSFPVCYKGLKFTLKTFNKYDMPNNVMHKQDESPAADSSASQNQHAASSEMVLEKIRVPLAGDLLGRERVTSAKKTRLGCDSSFERFDNIVECPALWHAKQSFLSVSLLYKTLISPCISLKPLSPKSDQHQFSPNNIKLYRIKEKFMRINKMIT